MNFQNAVKTIMALTAQRPVPAVKQTHKLASAQQGNVFARMDGYLRIAPSPAPAVKKTHKPLTAKRGSVRARRDGYHRIAPGPVPVLKKTHKHVTAKRGLVIVTRDGHLQLVLWTLTSAQTTYCCVRTTPTASTRQAVSCVNARKACRCMRAHASVSPIKYY